MRPLLVGDPDRAHLELVLVLLGPVYPHLESEDDVEGERKGKPSCDDGVADFGCCGEQTGKAAANLGNDGKGRELAGALRAVVLANLGQLGEEREGKSGELAEGHSGVGQDD